MKQSGKITDYETYGVMLTVLTNPYEPSIDMLELPEIAETKNGQKFNPREDYWVFADKTGRICMSFKDLYEFCTNELVVALKLALVKNLKRLAISTVSSRLDYFRHFVKKIIIPESDSKMSSISSIDIANYKGMLDINTECYLNALRGFLKSWSELGYPGIDNGVIQQLRKMRLKRRPRPLPSPLSEVDQVNFENKLHAAYEDRTINTRQYVLAWIGLTFAPRACQIASMKIKDLIVDTLSDGKLKYTLKVPRAKQRHQESSRDEFTDREPHEAGLGPLLSAWVKMVIDEFLNTVAEVSFDMQELPLFPKWSAKINEPGMKFHSDSRSIKSELITLAKKLKVQSIETGMNVNISWSILRDTLATRLVEEGKSLVQIALWLDHSGTRNVLHYASLTTKFRKKLDERLVFELAPIAQAFMGVIISDKSETQYDENRNTRLRNPEGDPDLGDVGICGKYGFCSGTMAPISCYTCSQFRAWRHGPHKEVLRLLIARREQLLANTNGDDRVSDSLNHVILAVGQVVMKCDEMPGRS